MSVITYSIFPRLFKIQKTMNTRDISSMQNTTTEASDVEKLDLHDDYKQLYLDIEWWIYVIAYITLPVVGGFGNILTFIVMQRGSLKEVSTCFYMSILAVADTGKSKATDTDNYKKVLTYFSCQEKRLFLVYY